MDSMDNQPKYDLPAFYTRRDRQRIKIPWYETSWGLVVVLPFALLVAPFALLGIWIIQMWKLALKKIRQS